MRQIVDRGYSVAEAPERLGVSAHSLYKWVNAVKPDKSDQQAADLVEAKWDVCRPAFMSDKRQRHQRSRSSAIV